MAKRQVRQGKASLFERGRFVAVDGEGFNAGPVKTWRVGKAGKEYRAQDHHYALLSASDGAELYNPTGRLSTKACFDFLIDIKRRDPDAIVVAFGAGYDMAHMLAFGLEREEIATLLHGPEETRDLVTARKVLDTTLGEHDYRIEFRNRKSLSIWRWPAGADKYERFDKRDGTRGVRLSKHDSVVLWDAWGFFQGSFVGAMANWLPGDPDAAMIKREKGNRQVFDRAEIDAIRRYNAAELRCLVAMMEKVRDAIRAMGLTITRWDGAGSIAGAMLKKYEIKTHMAQTPPDVFDAARIAYSGGHIEAMKLGYHRGTVHHYDVNSAYPDQFRNLPSLAMGHWRHGFSDDPVPMGFVLVRVQFRFHAGLPFYPLFYRQSNGAILYPERGEGWYWLPEFEVARTFSRRFGALTFEVLEWWAFETGSNDRPFAWIEDAYAQRQAIIAETRRTGIANGAEHTYKLGYNSCYGKSAQQVGARWELSDATGQWEIVRPAYFQLEWAGYVTAGCRAKLMAAAMQKPHAIISFATDGLYSTEPLDLDCPAEKVLGAWEYKTHVGMVLVMPGVYWLHDAATPKKPTGKTGYSRGFDKQTMEDDDFVLQGWARRHAAIEVPARRLITLGSALASDDFWDMRGMFAQTTRALELDGDNSKRMYVNLDRFRPHLGLVNTQPRDLMTDYDDDLGEAPSAPYPIAWLAELPPDQRAPAPAQGALWPGFDGGDADASFYADMVAAAEA